MFSLESKLGDKESDLLIITFINSDGYKVVDVEERGCCSLGW